MIELTDDERWDRLHAQVCTTGGWCSKHQSGNYVHVALDLAARLAQVTADRDMKAMEALGWKRGAERMAAQVVAVRALAEWVSAKEADFAASYRHRADPYTEGSRDAYDVVESRLRAVLQPTEEKP